LRSQFVAQLVQEIICIVYNPKVHYCDHKTWHWFLSWATSTHPKVELPGYSPQNFN